MSDNKNVSRRSSDAGIFEELRGIDIYLLDQLIKGRIRPGWKILDAGCGTGRNIRYLIKNGFAVWGVDKSEESIEALRGDFPDGGADHFRNEGLDALSFDDAEFNAIICNAVLHFARDEEHFGSMMKELWRVLGSGGLLFARLASSIGIEERVQQLDGRRYLLPDGTQRFLVDESFLLAAGEDLGCELLEPIKTVNVQGLRCMTTWVISKTV